MDLPAYPPADVTAKKLAGTLWEVGQTLKGRNLRRASWREIAEFVTKPGSLQTVVWERLRGARTRHDALRTLRLVRKRRRHQATSNRGRSNREVSRIPSVGGIEAEALRAQNSLLDELDERQRYGWWAVDWWDPADPGARDPWSLTVWSDEPESPLSGHERINSRVRQAIERLEPHRPWVPTDLVSTQSAPAEEGPLETAADIGPIADSPIESRLVQHGEAVIRNWNDSTFDQAITDGIGDVRNLHVLKEFAEDQNCPQLVNHLCLFAPFWIRPPVTWDGETELIDHLFVRHTSPRFLYKEWFQDEPRMKWLIWFVLLAQGGSLHRAAQHFNWQIPRKLQKHLMMVPDHLSPLQAVTCAEVQRLGGDSSDFRRLHDSPFVVDRTERPESPSFDVFWDETIRWLIEQRDTLPNDNVPMMLDWAMHKYTEAERANGRFSWKGRSVAAVLRRAEEYRDQLRKPYKAYRWKSHCQAFTYQDNLSDDSDVWSITELTSGEQLHDEGQDLQHCVAGYAARCAAGYSAIFSLRCNDERRVTIEIEPKSGRLVQSRGLRNRACKPNEREVIQRWLREVVTPTTAKIR